VPLLGVMTSESVRVEIELIGSARETGEVKHRDTANLPQHRKPEAANARFPDHAHEPFDRLAARRWRPVSNDAAGTNHALSSARIMQAIALALALDGSALTVPRMNFQKFK